ncbi:VIT domain-containing protein [uncultured Aquimonas sp.]|uniref:VIT domain-containing protein n=1 Tax=uncultured Aquimonas sp. TaxID=385483 RepID=UPI000A6155AE|nr:VIT domain-containing protein [uncultured Aquimonas sp.]
MRLLRLFVLLCACGGLTPAQALTPIPDTRPLPPPRVWIPPAEDLLPVQLQSVSIHIDSQGSLARTWIELSFHNPNARVLEGEFLFPLADGQTVSGYALEVEGAMREGVVVPKQTARVAFEEISRQQIDPGLAELTQGNVFRTRLYPIPARGNKRVALGFEQLMPLREGQYRYLLPLSFDAPIERFEVQALAHTGDLRPAPASPDPELRFDRAGPAWSAGFVRRNVQPQRELAFSIPAGAAPAVQIEAQDTQQPAWRSVIASIEPGARRMAPTAESVRVALFFDASASAARRDLERERAVLQAWIRAANVRELWLVPFRDAAEAPRRFDVANGNSAALLEAIEALPLDGGSRYGSLDLTSLPEVDRVLVLGDGLHNFGEASPRLQTRSGHQPRVSILLATQSADHQRLQRIATAQGGEVVDLLQLDAESALAALLADERRVLAVEVTGGHCEDLLPKAGEAAPMRLVVSARCEGESSLRLRVGNTQASEEFAIRVGESSPAEGALGEAVHRLRAQQQLRRMAAEDRPDTKAILALATRHGVVTPWTSLLVLDRIEDYVRYRIAPKEAELRAQYEQALAMAQKPDTSLSERDRIDRLLSGWAEFSRWHRRAHPWLETLLPQAASAEVALWQARAARDRSVRAELRQAQTLDKRIRTLQSRWPNEGSDARTRQRWEREAAEQLELLLALRARREALPELPRARTGAGRDAREDDAAGRQQAAMPSPAPSVPAPASAPVDANDMSLDQIVVTGARVSEGAEEDDGDPSTPRAEIRLQAWNPDTPYLQAMQAADDAYAEYLRQREAYGDTPGFFLDAADHLREVRGDAALAQRVLSNLAELSTENTALVRVLAHRLSQWGSHALAVQQFETALAQRPEEPQSHRDLALALARLPQPDYVRAIELLWKVALGDWSNRFPGIELIAAHEINDLIARAGPAQLADTLDALRIPQTLREPLPIGLRVTLGWDADNTDIDLWVIDPLGESVYYASNRSSSGGRVSQDLTQGYGPEVFTLTRPLPGVYRVQANYFGDRRQSLAGPVTVQLEFQTAFGTPDSERQATTRRLHDVRGRIDVGEFRVGLD